MPSQDVLITRLKALTGFRAFFVTLLLGSAYLFKVEYFYAHPKAISLFIISQYSLTIVYSLLIGRLKNLHLFTYVQLILDVLSEICLIYIAGGIESWLSFMLILTVLSSSIILDKKAGYVTASLSSILYGILLDLQFYRLLPLPYDSSIPEKEFLYNIFIHILALYVTAYLSGYLSSSLERTRQELAKKDSNLKDLEFFNVKVIESLPSGLFTTDLGGDVLIFNRAAEKITGIRREAVIGSKIGNAMPFLTFPFLEGRREGILESDKRGRKIIGITVTDVKDLSGRQTGFIGVFQDLTQIKQLEAEVKEKEKWAAIGELSANIAHEIRNPIASMRGSIEMLRDNRIPPKHRDQLMSIAVNEMERLNDIISDFLTYSSSRPPDLKDTDLHLLLDETLSLLENIEQNRGNITIKKDFDGPLFAAADPQKIRQVFWNLGVNAIEAMKDGGELAVSTGSSPDFVRIAFSDTGVGINPSGSEKIFYPFFTTKDGGTGLGLSIAYRIIEEHNGRLTVKSNPGIKTVFEIILHRENGRHQGENSRHRRREEHEGST
ncbi:MAG: ATP-binding protein [Candidatus Sulfobium sp.]|jgi:two-component system sensor histidine kinase PilS (NtrC family)